MESLDDRDLDDLLEDTLGEFSDEITSHPGIFTNRHSTFTYIQGNSQTRGYVDTHAHT
jgi:hypothetical protein